MTSLRTTRRLEAAAPRQPARAAGRRGQAGDLVLGRYRLAERIGAGGFGTVWRARDERLERDVAVKVVARGADEREALRVEREALAAARLNHPGIVALYELASDAHDTYLVCELVHGATLEVLARDGAVSDRDVARIGAALCEALEHAHARGVIHRDVKPANVMVVAEPAAGAGFAKLTDFGIARVERGDQLTATGDVVGTLAYMAPEQAEGGPLTPACDVYSLALTLYEAWTGVNPVRGASPADTARRVGAPLPALAALRGDLPRALCEAVDAALEREPDLRPLPAELGRALTDSAPDLSDSGGLVEPATLHRFGLTAVRTRTRLTRLLAARRGRPAAGAALRVVAATRAAAGLAAGGLALAAIEGLGPAPPFSAPAVALGVGLGVALLPRLGWIAAGLGVIAWLASPTAGQAGTALVLAAALAAVPLLLMRAGLLWSLPAAAPLLGAVGLAPAFVGGAGLVAGAWRRAGLGAAGAVWVAVAETLTGRRLLLGAPGAVDPRSQWSGSVLDAASHALAPLLTLPGLLTVIAWAAFAVALPVLVRGRFATLDTLLGAAWGAGLALTMRAIGGLGSAPLMPRGAVAGAVVAAVVAVAVTRIAPPARDEPDLPALP